MAVLQRFDAQTGKPIESIPAVLAGHLLSPQSDDIAMAYINIAPDPQAKSLFVTVLHKLPDGYVKVFEKSYYGKFLWVQNFETVGLKVLKLPGELTDSLVVVTARGASLGAQAELYRWEDGVGMVDLMPRHLPAHRVSFVLDKDHLLVKLSFEKYSGEKGVPPPILYRWDGHQLTRAER